MTDGHPSGPEAVVSFQLRGHYPNQRSMMLNFDLRTTGANQRRRPNPGYSPPVVDYVTGSGNPGRIEVRDVDVEFLCLSDSDSSLAHLELIVAARGGDMNAVRALNAAVTTRGGDTRDLLRTLEENESRMIVPSTSSQTYPEGLVSHKGHVLLQLSRLGYPVPDFAILTSDVYRERNEALSDHLGTAIDTLEKLTRKKLGSPESPLIFAMRCAMPRYVPGIMPTYLNVGTTRETIPALQERYGEDATARILLNNCSNLLDLMEPESGKQIRRRHKGMTGPGQIAELAREASELVDKLDPKVLSDAHYQTRFFVERAYLKYEQHSELLATLARGERLDPALILQEMVCTVRDDNAYAGVVFSRHWMTGKGMLIESANRIFGEEIMTGSAEATQTPFEDREQIRESHPAIYHFAPHIGTLERTFGSPVTIEFAADATEQHQLFAMLQLNESSIAGRAAIVSVMEMYKSGIIPKSRVTELICPYHLRELERDAIAESSLETVERFCGGLSILPRSAVSARIYFTTEAALKAKRAGKTVCLCKRTFFPEDTVAMREVDAILSMTSAAIHVVTICQSYGVPALLNLGKHGARMGPGNRLTNREGEVLQEGDWVTLSSWWQSIFRGKARYRPARLMSYIRGEPVWFDEGEEEMFVDIANAYGEYNKLVETLELDDIPTLGDLKRLVNIELEQRPERATRIVNAWFDRNPDQYLDGVLASELGDHLSQYGVFSKLSLFRRVDFFRKALAKCREEGRQGYTAGAFMIGRFVCNQQPALFWQKLNDNETAMLLNEWVHIEKYSQLLREVGERKVARAKRKLLTEGLGRLTLETGSVKNLITLKLSGRDLSEIGKAVPEDADPQTHEVISLLERPYDDFYDFDSQWSVRELELLCKAEKITMPKVSDS